MNTLKKLLALGFLTCIVNIATAQTYNTGIGIRLGGQSSGITFRHFTNGDGAIEGIVSLGHKSFIVTGLYEKFKPINNAPGLQWFYGGGLHIGFFSYGGHYNRYKDHGHYYYVEEEGGTAVVPGVDFIIGLDYKFDNAPINIGLDLKPFIDFDNGLRGYWDGAFSFRFVF
ncbi:MAG: hypothetical protein ACHQF2_11390 [Flavobacteriales bacterium]